MSLFKFNRMDTIGSADAEEDSFLNEAFLDTGALSVLLDTNDGRRIVIGRTGVGKTALLRSLTNSAENVINIPPDTLSLSYISNSTILKFLAQLGVKLDIFYKLLWRHVFTVEIIKSHFKLDSQQSKESFIQKIMSVFRDDKHKRALRYLEDWGSSFWQDTDYRIKELTTKLEGELKSSIKTGIPHLNINSSIGNKVTEEEKQEVIHRAQDVVNKVQIKELSDILEVLDEILDDKQKRYFLVVDKLDEQWIDDQIRYHLIRALIETARDFKKVRNTKIVIAIRRDLIDRVFRLTRDPGFQEEKYEALFLPLTWTADQLQRLVDLRINALAERKGIKKPIFLRDVITTRKKTSAKDLAEYMTNLTLLRPRDIIMYTNFCIQMSENKSSISLHSMSEAEGEYSRNRLRSLADEWFADYPNLMDFTNILKTRQSSFVISDITDDQCEAFALDTLVKELPKDFLVELSMQYFNNVVVASGFRRGVIAVFYKIGLVGIKLDSYENTSWGYTGNRTISTSEITDSCRICIHPAFRRALGIRNIDGKSLFRGETFNDCDFHK